MKIAALIVLFGLCYTVSAATVSKECSYGQSYWCHSLRSAKECGAMKHCIQAVWEKQTMSKDNDGVCQICLDMVTQARDTLRSNDTQEMIKQVFEGSCNLIPIDLVREECVALADDFIPELIETLSSEMDPEVVCATAGLCNSVRVDRMIKKYLLTHKEIKSTGESYDMKTNTNRDCTDCHVFVQDVSKAVKSHSRHEVLQHLLAICGRVSSLSDGCRMLVQSNFAVIYDFLAYEMNADEVCDLFGLCASFIQKRVVHEDIPCEFCEDIVKHWKEQLSSNTTIEQFKEILAGICAHTGKFQQECDSLVQQYYEPLYEFLISQVAPREICAAVGLCGKNSVFNEETPVWTLFGIRPEDHISFEGGNLIGQDEANSYKHDNDEELIGQDEANSYKIDSKDETPKVNVLSHGNNGVIKRKSDTCVMCEFTLHYLQDLLQDKPTREEVKEALEKVCTLLPHNLSEQCDDYVEAYGDQLIQLLILEMDPAKICPMLGLCPGTKKGGVFDDVSCTLCEFAMTQLEDMLEDKKTEDNIRNALDKVCSILPKTIRKECKNFIDEYTDQIVHLLIDDFTPDQICQQLGLCKDNLSSIAASKKQLPISRMFILDIVDDVKNPVKKGSMNDPKWWDQSIQCVFCEFIVARADKVLANQTVQDEIKVDVSKLCLLLPTTLMNDCLGFMEEYGQGLVEMILNSLDPSVVCRNFKLCKASSVHGLPKASVEKFPIDKCLICEEIVEKTYEIVQSEHIPETVDSLIKNVCNPIKNIEEREACHFLVVMYGPYFSKLMDELKKPKMVCQAIKECPPSKKPLLLGAERCTWGPSYWCKTPMHAESCKATKHCHETVWSKQAPTA